MHTNVTPNISLKVHNYAGYEDQYCCPFKTLSFVIP
jgi:hypothetical protein